MKHSEVITFQSVDEGLPDDDTTVLLSLDDSHGEPVWLGWHADGQWFDAATAGPIEGVTGWADMPAGLRDLMKQRTATP